jgi:hypothetical protein
MYKVIQLKQEAPIDPNNQWWYVVKEEGKYYKIIKWFTTVAEAEEFIIQM